MDQFIVRPLFRDIVPGTCNPAAGLTDGCVRWYEPTNVTLWLMLSVLAIIALFMLGTRGRALIPSRVQSMAELSYGMVHKIVEDVAGREGLKYFP